MKFVTDAAISSIAHIGPLMISLAGQTLSNEEKEMLSLPAVGGIILFARNYGDKDQLLKLTADIRAINPVCIIAVDHEGGRVQRLLQGFTRIPAAAKFGELYDTDPARALELAYAAGSIIACELSEVGINLSFCPVLDLNTGGGKTIGDRAFHSTATVVAALAAAFINGLHSGKLLSVGKHYPGHGSVAADTHEQQVIDHRPLENILQQDLMPYRYLMQRDLLDAVMTAHVMYEKVDAMPATISSHWLQNILRGEQHFTGVIFSDDLSMSGISDILRTRSIAEIMAAGCQMLLVCNDTDLIRSTIHELSVADIQDDLSEHCNALTAQWKLRWQLLQQRKQIPVDLVAARAGLKQLTNNSYA